MRIRINQIRSGKYSYQQNVSGPKLSLSLGNSDSACCRIWSCEWKLNLLSPPPAVWCVGGNGAQVWDSRHRQLLSRMLHLWHTDLYLLICQIIAPAYICRLFMTTQNKELCSWQMNVLPWKHLNNMLLDQYFFIDWDCIYTGTNMCLFKD